jgi:hypothetical protein
VGCRAWFGRKDVPGRPLDVSDDEGEVVPDSSGAGSKREACPTPNAVLSYTGQGTLPSGQNK